MSLERRTSHHPMQAVRPLCLWCGQAECRLFGKEQSCCGSRQLASRLPEDSTIPNLSVVHSERDCRENKSATWLLPSALRGRPTVASATPPVSRRFLSVTR